MRLRELLTTAIFIGITLIQLHISIPVGIVAYQYTVDSIALGWMVAYVLLTILLIIALELTKVNIMKRYSTPDHTTPA